MALFSTFEDSSSLVFFPFWPGGGHDRRGASKDKTKRNMGECLILI